MDSELQRFDEAAIWLIKLANSNEPLPIAYPDDEYEETLLPEKVNWKKEGF